MKSLLCALSLVVCGCSTVYKVDSKGICHAPDGKIVKIPDLDKFNKKAGTFMDNIFPDGRRCQPNINITFIPFAGSSAYGGFYGSPAGS